DLLVSQEAVKHIARVNVVSSDRPVRSDGAWDGALARVRARAQRVERGDGAVFRPHEAVKHIARVKDESRDRPIRINACGERTPVIARAPARSIERGDGAVLVPQETVTRIARVRVVSRDRPLRVDDGGAERESALWVRSRDSSIEHGKSAVLSANVGVNHIAPARYNEPSRDRPAWVDAVGAGALEVVCARARSVEHGSGAVLVPQKTAPRGSGGDPGVTDESHDRPVRGDARGDGTLESVRACARNIERDDGGIFGSCVIVDRAIRRSLSIIRDVSIT